jgi:hypothetical protein
MVSQISGIYFQSYQLAYDVAKRAERAYRFELGQVDSNFIQFGYWDSLKQGLLAGERLHYDLKRLEVAYLDQNKREYEITKHVSVRQLKPEALLELRANGKCEASLPEALFDLDYPGHYLRRIKSISVSVPCVTGPYASVNCTLRLMKSTIRHDKALRNNKYIRDDHNDDSRFTDDYGSIQSIVTSSGQNDSGLFETNLHDERYLPFEGSGAISTWQVELPNDFRQFDYDTISDVILHVRYTAREGGDSLRQQATTELQAAVNAMVRNQEQHGLAQLFSLRHDFPTEWYRFTATADAYGNHTQAFSLSKERFPFLFQSQTMTITQLDVFGQPKSAASTIQLNSLQVKTPGYANPVQEAEVVKLEDGDPIEHIAHKTASTNLAGVALGIDVKPVPNQAAQHEADWVLTINGSESEKLDDILIVCSYQVKS